MAYTIDQWHAKIKKFVPSWHFENPTGRENALFYATAALFQQIQQDSDDAQAQTFIMQSANPVDDLHGDERTIKRLSGELDAKYNPRIRDGIFIPVSKSQIQKAIDAQLNNGTSFLIENVTYGYYDDPDNNQALFFDDYNSRRIDGRKFYNWWTAIIPLQTAGDQNQIRANIISAIEANKAEGTTYDILYRSSDDTDSED